MLMMMGDEFRKVDYKGVSNATKEAWEVFGNMFVPVFQANWTNELRENGEDFDKYVSQQDEAFVM